MMMMMMMMMFLLLLLLQFHLLLLKYLTPQGSILPHNLTYSQKNL